MGIKERCSGEFAWSSRIWTVVKSILGESSVDAEISRLRSETLAKAVKPQGCLCLIFNNGGYCVRWDWCEACPVALEDHLAYRSHWLTGSVLRVIKRG